MTDGSEQCLKLILERIENIKTAVEHNAAAAQEYRHEMRETVGEIKNSVRRHQDDVDHKFGDMNHRVDAVDDALSSVLRDRAKITGAVKALALLWAGLVAVLTFAPGLVKDVVNGALKQ